MKRSWRERKALREANKVLKSAPAKALTTERNTTHGDFPKNALVSQSIKDFMDSQGAKSLCPVHREALDMIALKISRILSGRATVKDHWDDIAGYARLASEVCDA